ncbi:putative multi-domain containing protein [Aduncisulcus paluster]|uniref:NEDD8-activating enzyme E1 catalytic subunit n=1 Tax=Aduncisulcus paluster TaxID=2918883 RepID=A0ABQ5K6F7_9EUKA|nr:putative multi-domain containing protein [Aduncisulcus paluster]
MVLVSIFRALGCEIIQLLLESGFFKFILCDIDKVEAVNIPHQSLFSMEDVGEYKVDAAKKYIDGYVSSNQFDKIDDKDKKKAIVSTFTGDCCELSTDLFSSSLCVFLCVDNLETREKVNKIVVSIVRKQLGLPLLIEGGTSGILGHARIIVPGYTPCLSCYETYSHGAHIRALCSIREIPRTPADCVVSVVMGGIFEEEHDGRSPVSISVEDSKNVLELSRIQAAKYKIVPMPTMDDVSYVMNKSAPTIPETNNLVAAVMVEALFCSCGIVSPLGKEPVNYWQISMGKGPSASPMSMVKNDHCHISMIDIQALITELDSPILVSIIIGGVIIVIGIIFLLLKLISPKDCNIVITGPSGTNKTKLFYYLVSGGKWLPSVSSQQLNEFSLGKIPFSEKRKCRISDIPGSSSLIKELMEDKLPEASLVCLCIDGKRLGKDVSHDRALLSIIRRVFGGLSDLELGNSSTVATNTIEDVLGNKLPEASLVCLCIDGKRLGKDVSHDRALLSIIRRVFGGLSDLELGNSSTVATNTIEDVLGSPYYSKSKYDVVLVFSNVKSIEDGTKKLDKVIERFLLGHGINAKDSFVTCELPHFIIAEKSSDDVNMTEFVKFLKQKL